MLILQVLFTIVCPAAVSGELDPLGLGSGDPPHGAGHRNHEIPPIESLYNVRPPATIAKLVPITPITMVYGMQITN